MAWDSKGHLAPREGSLEKMVGRRIDATLGRRQGLSLAGFSRKNLFYRANRELGRVFKTEFILQYMSQSPLRRRVRRGLLKGEQLHTLARDVCYGKRGRITARDLHEQMNTCSCVTLILACIIYWQAKEIERVIAECDPAAEAVDVELLELGCALRIPYQSLESRVSVDQKLAEVAAGGPGRAGE